MFKKIALLMLILIAVLLVPVLSGCEQEGKIETSRELRTEDGRVVEDKTVTRTEIE